MANTSNGSRSDRNIAELTQTIDDQILLAVPASVQGHIPDPSLSETIDDSQLADLAADLTVTPYVSGNSLFPASVGKGRFEIGDLLGSGGSGSVYDLLDHNLKRTVAVKFLSMDNSDDGKAVKKFMLEALLTSHLEHPHIPPVYDLDMEKNKQIYYTMKKIKGVPLSILTGKAPNDGDTFKSSIANRFDTILEITSIFIKTSEAIAYAHSRGIIHRDIKPDNIMIGEYGEIYIVDWGIAYDKTDNQDRNGRMSGTPLYMSPEQARKELADECSDIYCIGTTFFHVLFKQFPFAVDNVELFWVHKKRGHLIDLDPEFLSKVPAPLAAICLKCLSPDPKNRYSSAASLLADLKNFQSGGIVAAYNYSALDTIKRHLKKVVRHIIWILLFTGLLGFTSLMIYQRYQREVAGWGDPIYTETFENLDIWNEQWISQAGSTFELENNKLVTKKGPEFIWFYKKRIHSGMAIEFEGEMLDGSKLGDLSVIFSPDIKDLIDGKRPKNIYYLQHGALDNSCSMIEGPDGRLDYKLLKLKHGKTYKVRGEIDGKNIRLFLDDKLICSYELLLPLNGGHIGIYAYYENKSIDNIKIYSKELPELTDITATGDLLFENDQFQLASERYRTISEAHAGTATGDENLYKLGLCYHKMDLVDEALRIWSKINRPEYNNQINHYRWEQLYSSGQHDTVLKEMHTEYVKTINPKQIMHEWAIHLQDAVNKGKIDIIEKFLEFRNTHFPQDQILSQMVVDALKVTGEASKALVLFPEQDHIVIQALKESGRYKDIIVNYPLQQAAVADALFYSGQYSQIIDEHSEFTSLVYLSLIASGRIDEAEQKFGEDPGFAARIRLQGRGELQTHLDEAAENRSIWMSSQLYSLNEQAFLDAAALNPAKRTKQTHDAYTSLALKEFLSTKEANALETIRNLSNESPGMLRSDPNAAFSVYYLYPILQYFEGNEDLLKSAVKIIQTKLKSSQGLRLFYCSKLLMGEIGQHEFFNQPTQHYIECDYAFYRALQQDLKGRKNIALQLYREFEGLPPYKKYFDATMKRFVNYRIEVLSTKKK